MKKRGVAFFHTVIDDLSVVLPVNLFRFRNRNGGAVDVNVLADDAGLKNAKSRPYLRAVYTGDFDAFSGKSNLKNDYSVNAKSFNVTHYSCIN